MATHLTLLVNQKLIFIREFDFLQLMFKKIITGNLVMFILMKCTNDFKNWQEAKTTRPIFVRKNAVKVAACILLM